VYFTPLNPKILLCRAGEQVFRVAMRSSANGLALVDGRLFVWTVNFVSCLVSFLKRDQKERRAARK